MCDHTLHYGKKHFYSYCFQAFNTEEILKRHINHILNLGGSSYAPRPPPTPPTYTFLTSVVVNIFT